jgi:glycosyltransferase involved in cell wall biosynthesis
VFTAPADGAAPDPGRALVHRIDPVFAIGNAPLIPALARVEGFDVVHLHYPFIFGSELTLLGRLASSRRRQALLVHYKNRLVGKGAKGGLFEVYERTVAPVLARAADRLCVLSLDHSRTVSYLSQIEARDPAKLIELPNGVDTEAFSPGVEAAVRARLGIPDNAVVAAYVAALDRAHHYKRVDLAIDGVARLGDERLHLVIAGGGERLEGFRRHAAATGVGERVHFLGPVPHAELPTVLRAADLFVLTTEPPESFGIVLIEAMACGLPTIATDFAGVRAVVDHGETGFLIPRGDLDALTTALHELVEAGPDGRTRMGAAGRAKAEASWSWPALIDRLDAAYAEAISARRAKRSTR